MSDVGTFRTTIAIEHLSQNGKIREAIVHVAGVAIPDFVVFAEANDTTLLGVHTLEGLNLKIDAVNKELVDAGPIITAAA